MKKYSNEELKEIKANLNNGVKYTGVKNNTSTGVIYKSGKNIAWRYFGESTICNNLKELKWLLNKIFGECDFITECKWSDYHINYKAIDDKYRCIDMSKSHPNVCGL